MGIPAEPHLSLIYFSERLKGMVAFGKMAFRRTLACLLTLALLSPLAGLAAAEQDEQNSDHVDTVLVIAVNEDGTIDITMAQEMFSTLVEGASGESADTLPPIASIQMSIGLDDAGHLELDDFVITLADELPDEVTVSVSLSDGVWELLQNGNLTADDILNMIPLEMDDEKDESEEEEFPDEEPAEDEPVDEESDPENDEQHQSNLTVEECEEFLLNLRESMNDDDFDESDVDWQMFEDCQEILFDPVDFDEDDFADDEQWDDEHHGSEEDCHDEDEFDDEHPWDDIDSEEWEELWDAWDNLIEEYNERLADIEEREQEEFSSLSEECEEARAELIEDYYENYYELLEQMDENLEDIEELHESDLEALYATYEHEYSELEELLNNSTTDAEFEEIMHQMAGLLQQAGIDIDSLADHYELWSQEIHEEAFADMDELLDQLDADFAALDEECHAAMEALRQQFEQEYEDLDDWYQEQAEILDARMLELVGEDADEPVDERHPDEESPDEEDVNDTSSTSNMESNGDFGIGDTVPGFTGLLSVVAMSGAVLLAGRRRLL